MIDILNCTPLVFEYGAKYFTEFLGMAKRSHIKVIGDEDDINNTQYILCCLCRKNTSEEMGNDLYIVRPDGEYTQFGLVLIYLLKMVSI